jgi:5-methylcytosine-specific restriction endonuclease McrA
MALSKLQKFFTGPAPRLSRQDAMKVFTRDQFKCQYCGLDGLHQFTNWLVLTVDHVHPHAHGGTRKMENLVTCCQPCNVIKGKRIFKSFEDAKAFVLKKRKEWEQLYLEQAKAAERHVASHQSA